MWTILIKICRVLIGWGVRVYGQLLANDSSRKFFPLINPAQQIDSSRGEYLRLLTARFANLPGMISDRQAQVLFELCVSQAISGNIVEIGSWLGKSTLFLASGCRVSGNGQVYAVDKFTGNLGKEDLYHAPLLPNETIYDRFKFNIKSYRLNKFVKAYPMSSRQARRKIKQTLRMVFIDGDHSYKGVMDDIKLWTPLLKKGGLLILDDFDQSFPGVVRAVQEKILHSAQFKPLFELDSLLVARKG